ncbi:MAG: hypothetical protein ACF8PG_08950, partial [Maioricimonas sp. JB045]
MTAEVVVLNSSAVALAADSAVTIGRDADKVYTSAEKLFQLSQVSPLGIMVYGNAELCGLPWETVIKTFRSRHGRDEFSTVRECAERFLEFLSGARQLFPRQRQNMLAKSMMESLLRYVRKQLRERLDREAEERDGLDDEDLPQIVEEVASEMLGRVRQHDFLVSFDKDGRADVFEYFREAADDAVNAVFGELILTETARETLVSIPLEMLVRSHFSASTSGIVFAGFGKDEYMPSLVSYELDGIVLDTPRWIQTGAHSVGDRMAAAVIPFAQKDMVQAFMDGVDQRLQRVMEDSTGQLFRGIVDVLVDFVRQSDPQLADEMVGRTASALEELHGRLVRRWSRERQKRWQPIIEVVQSLPKDEVAAMAEA